MKRKHEFVIGVGKKRYCWNEIFNLL